MSLARIKTWSTNEGLLATDLNAEFDNILTHGLSLISPMTANLDAAGFRVTDLAAATTNGDLARFDDVPLIATQAQQETATNITAAVTPGRLHFHPSACKVWATAYADGTVASSYNLSVVTDLGVGDINFTYLVAFSGAATYVPIMTADNNGIALTICIPGTSTSSAEGVARNTAGTHVDPQSWSIAAFGDYP